jgi:hypothetical protein
MYWDNEQSITIDPSNASIEEFCSNSNASLLKSFYPGIYSSLLNNIYPA